jgi:hypothetical protein
VVGVEPKLHVGWFEDIATVSRSLQPSDVGRRKKEQRLVRSSLRVEGIYRKLDRWVLLFKRVSSKRRQLLRDDCQPELA